MTTTRRNVMWPLVVVVVGCTWLLMVAGAFPAAVGDILQRAWPALLVLFGLDVLVGQRKISIAGRAVPLSSVALLGVVALLAGVVWMAYNQQAEKLRDDTQVVMDEILPDEVERVVFEIGLKRTGITVTPDDTARRVTARFSGSKESLVDMAWNLDGTTAVVTITETYRHSIPKLDEFGRGTIAITVPTGITIEQLALSNQEGDVTLELRPVLIQSLSLTAGKGDATVTVPDQMALLGDLRVGGGGLTVRVPLTLALSIGRGAGSGTPRYTYDADRYFLLAGGDLKRQNSPEFNVALTAWLDSGASLVVSDIE